MAQNEDFLQQFEESVANLSKINDAIVRNSTSKNTFLKLVTEGLNEINGKIQTLGVDIAKMKNDLDNLQNQVDSNTSDISNHASRKQELEAEVAKLTQERDDLSNQMMKLQEKMNAEEAKLQEEIDLKEEQITQLTTDNTNLKQQVDTLNGELGNKGDTQKQHADEIEKLTQQNIQALKEQQEKNDQEIAEIKAQIEAKDKQIEELNQSTGAASQQLSQQLKECQDKELEYTAQIESLNQQITQLTQQNQVLTERIKSATEAINLTVSKLNELTDDVADAKNTDDVKKIFQEINDTIDKINMTIKSQSIKTATAVEATTSNTSNTQSSVNTSAASLPPTTSITFKDGQTVPLSSIKEQLNIKNNQLKGNNPNNKYALALNNVKKASTPEEVLNALSSNGVQWKNDKIMGGKKSKTYKKNKRGGFTYKKLSRNSKSSTKGGRKRKHKSRKM
jgi:chromosome segregation ATPase